jgi:hypothetical protein
MIVCCGDKVHTNMNRRARRCCSRARPDASATAQIDEERMPMFEYATAGRAGANW